LIPITFARELQAAGLRLSFSGNMVAVGMMFDPLELGQAGMLGAVRRLPAPNLGVWRLHQVQVHRGGVPAEWPRCPSPAAAPTFRSAKNCHEILMKILMEILTLRRRVLGRSLRTYDQRI
jgi:hypothetical protein